MDLEEEDAAAVLDEISYWVRNPLTRQQTFMCQPCVTTSIMLYTNCHRVVFD